MFGALPEHTFLSARAPTGAAEAAALPHTKQVLERSDTSGHRRKADLHPGGAAVEWNHRILLAFLLRPGDRLNCFRTSSFIDRFQKFLEFRADFFLGE